VRNVVYSPASEKPDPRGGVQMDADQIMCLLPHRSPFLLLDRVILLDPPARAVGLKNVTIAEPWFAGHFPARAILPGVLVTECLAQLAGVLIAAEKTDAQPESEAAPDRIGLLAEVKQFRYRRPIVPGDQLRLEVELRKQIGNLREFGCQASVAGVRAAHGALVVTTLQEDTEMYAGTLAHLHPQDTEYRDVAGTRLPWTFSDYTTEYNAIRNSAALFDHTAVGLTRLSGDVIPLLQRVLARDVEFLMPERCMVTLMLDNDGQPIDLMTVYAFDDYAILESTYGRQDATRKHIAEQAGSAVEITALDGEWGMLAIEGPYSWGAVGRVLDPAITALPYESVMEVDYDGTPIIFSRSGFTGEYGYKIIGPSATLAELWERLRTEATPTGQQALETAMLEVRQPVLHREIAADAGVVACGIQWLTDPTKQEFIGRAPIMAQLGDATSPRMLGLSWQGDDLPAGSDVLAGDTVIGKLRVSVFSPSLSKWLGLATVDPELATPGLTLDLRGPGGYGSEAVSVSSPYVVPTSWSTPIL